MLSVDQSSESEEDDEFHIDMEEDGQKYVKIWHRLAYMNIEWSFLGFIEDFLNLTQGFPFKDFFWAFKDYTD